MSEGVGRSPIEMMVDKACGFDASAPRPPRVTIYCPKCKRRQSVAKHETDPPNTATVCIQCPKCNSGDFDTPSYYDAQGRELDFETGEPFQ